MKKYIKKLTPLFIIVVIIFIIYSPTLNHGFIENWDDDVAFDNPDIQGINWENVKHWFSKGYLRMFQPLTISTYALNYEIGGLDPFGYHLFNIIVFCCIVLLLWQLLNILSNNYWAATVVSFFFALHPFAVEYVAWVSGRIALLMVFFSLLSLNFHASGRRNFLILAGLYLLTILSKINGLLLPIYLLIIDMVKQNKPFSIKNLVPKIGLFVVALPVLIFSLSLRRSDASMSLYELILLAPAKYLWYLNHILPVYKYSPVYDIPTYFEWRNLIGLLFITLIIWGYLKFSTKNKGLIIIGFLIFIFSLLPHMVPFSLGAHVGDGYGFVSYIGLAIVIFAFMNEFSEKRSVFIGLMFLIGSISVINAFHTHQYNKQWKNSYTLWEHAVEVVPGNYIAHAKLGAWYLINKDKRAKEELITAITLEPGYADPYYNMGSLNFFSGNYQGAVEYYTKYYELGKNTRVLISRANSYFALQDYENTIKDLDVYISDYNDANAFLLRGQSKFKLGFDGCSDLKKALDLGLNDVLPIYARDCMLNPGTNN